MTDEQINQAIAPLQEMVAEMQVPAPPSPEPRKGFPYYAFEDGFLVRTEYDGAVTRIEVHQECAETQILAELNRLAEAAARMDYIFTVPDDRYHRETWIAVWQRLIELPQNATPEQFNEIIDAALEARG